MTTIASIIFYAIAMLMAAVFGHTAGKDDPDTGLFAGAWVFFALGLLFQVFG